MNVRFGDKADVARTRVHGIDAVGNVIVRRQLKRRYILRFFQKLPPCPLVLRLRFITSLVARGPGTRAHGAPDASGLREALRQATEERRR
jgi:transposase